ncbi:MAG TPA: hypothetical protein VM287_02990 [Egibacteraceae bacterium]|nr:hypothetical protein [Egibacteraceae bacterium]
MARPLLGDVVHGLLESHPTATALLDARQHVVECGLLSKALQLSGQILLERLTSLLGPSLELGMDVIWEVSH